MTARNITDHVKQTLERHGLLPDGAPVVLMASGGADSTALLLLFAQGVLGKHPAIVVHLNHGLRVAGGEAAEDERFVRELCERLDIAFVSKTIDIATVARERKANIEAVGREERYRFAASELEALCSRESVPFVTGRIITAHTLSDRVETCLMRMIVGGGPGSLASIRHQRENVVRPLLDVTKYEVRDFLRAQGQAWREDETNQDTDYLRAFVRHEIVPRFELKNPRFEVVLARSLDIAAEEDDFLGSLASDEFDRVLVDVAAGEGIVLDARRLREVDPVIAKRVLRMGILLAFPGTRLESGHLTTVLGELSSRACFVSDIAGDLRVRAEYDRLTIQPKEGIRAQDPAHEGSPTAKQVLKVPGRTVVRPGSHTSVIEAKVIEASRTELLDRLGVDSVRDLGQGDFSEKHARVFLDAGSLDVRGLVARGIQEADRITPLGMEKSKKVSDVLIDRKVPKSDRREVVVIEDGERIAWLAGVHTSDDYKIEEDTETVLELTWYEEPVFDTSSSKMESVSGTGQEKR